MFVSIALLSWIAARRWRHDPSQTNRNNPSSGPSVKMPKSFARAWNVSFSSSDVVWDISPAGPMSIVNCRERRLRPCDDSSVLAYTLKRFGTVRSVIGVRLVWVRRCTEWDTDIQRPVCVCGAGSRWLKMGVSIWEGQSERGRSPLLLAFQGIQICRRSVNTSWTVCNRRWEAYLIAQAMIKIQHRSRVAGVKDSL
jgi:hypothetical protein